MVGQRAGCGLRCGGGTVPAALGEQQVARVDYFAEGFLSKSWVLER